MNLKFDIGQEIYCINNDFVENTLTIHKKYIVHDIIGTIDNPKVRITNNNHVKGSYYNIRFVSLKEFRLKKLKELLNEI